MRQGKNWKRKVETISQKVNRVLNFILIAFLLVALRVWYLTVIQHEERLDSSRKPQKKVVVEPAKRGTIRDRFNDPIAINKLQYQAAITYSQIAQLPSVKISYNGKERVKRYVRKEHISSLSKILAETLELDAGRVEDLIYSKASFFYHIPFVIKENITEKQYYKLKILEKDLPGLTVCKVGKRNYPKEKLASDVIGYMGSISRDEYTRFLASVKELQKCIEFSENGIFVDFPEGINSLDQAKERLQELQELAYTMNDFVGKSGIEEKFEKKLRGQIGKKYYTCDAKGNFLFEHPNSKSEVSGDRILLTISSELQEFAEKILIQNESIRPIRASSLDGHLLSQAQEPWIKGGAVIAMDPINGEVLALASFPRTNPNDFVSSSNERKNVHQWFETEQCISEIWEQKRPLIRESFDPLTNRIVLEEMTLNWNRYLEFILLKNSPLDQVLRSVQTLGEVIDVSDHIDHLFECTKVSTLLPIFNFIYSKEPHQVYQKKVRALIKETLEENIYINKNEIEKIKSALDPYFSKLPNNYDKVLFVDLCRLIIDSTQVNDPSIREIKIDDFLKMQSAFLTIKEVVYEKVKQAFSCLDFALWRENNIKAFLKQKRKEEKAALKKYSTPYLDLLDDKEKELFQNFWEDEKWNLILTFITGQSDNETPYTKFLKTLPEYEEAKILKDRFSTYSYKTKINLLKCFRSFYELDRTTLGKYPHLKKEAGVQKEKHLAQAFYPKYGFGFGRSYAWRQAMAPGSVFKLITAYQALKESLNPLVIQDDYYKVGSNFYVGTTEKGVAIPQLYKGGRIPRSHRAGLGKMDLLRAMETSSNPYFSLLASDVISHPNDLIEAAKDFGFGEVTGIGLPGEKRGNLPADLDLNPTGLYTTAVGQHTLLATPLQVAVMLSTLANGGKVIQPKLVHLTASTDGVTLYPTKIKREIFLPTKIQEILVEGMRRVATNIQQASSVGLASIYKNNTHAIADLNAMKGQMIGKSSTAECVEILNMDCYRGTNRYNHLWFGAVFYEPKENDQAQFVKPELVVVVFGKYGAWGKDIAPLACQVASKWREIKRAQQN